MYNALIGLREQCHHFPSTHAGKNSNKNQISDDVKTNKSFFYLLPDKKLHQVNFSEISWLYKSESRQSFQLRFVMVRLKFFLTFAIVDKILIEYQNVLRIQHLRRLHTFSRLYALRDRPDIADTIMSQEADHKENAQFIGELKKMLEETTRSMFDELNQVLHQGKSIISGSWNGVLDTISKSTYDVALWKLMAENIDILSYELWLFFKDCSLNVVSSEHTLRKRTFLFSSEFFFLKVRLLHGIKVLNSTKDQLRLTQCLEHFWVGLHSMSSAISLGA